MRNDVLTYLLLIGLMIFPIFGVGCSYSEPQYRDALKSDKAAVGRSSASEFLSIFLPDGRRLIVTDYEYYDVIGGDDTALKLFTQNQYRAYLTYLEETRFKDREEAITYVHSRSFYKPMTFEQLSVQDESELIETYFEYDFVNHHGREDGRKRIPSDPAFIGLLLDLGYRVGHGDAIPFMWIRKQGPEEI